MCQNAEKCIDRTSFLTFMIPFLIGGVWFSFVAQAYLNTLPQIIVSVYDRAYAVVLAFVDMGFAFGAAGFTLLCLIRQVKSVFQKLGNRKVSTPSDS